MKWSIIGSGGFVASRHFKAIKEIGDKVILTCDIDETKLADFRSYEVMMQSENGRKSEGWRFARRITGIIKCARR